MKKYVLPFIHPEYVACQFYQVFLNSNMVREGERIFCIPGVFQPFGACDNIWSSDMA